MEDKERLHRYILFSYRSSFPSGNGVVNKGNIGDNIQTIATEHAISQIDKQAEFVRVQRDRLVSYENKPPAICVMQGWFEHKISWLNFLPGPSVIPVWLGTHLQPVTRELLRPFLSICKGVAFRDEEIGCRDKATLQFCKAWGISAYFSRCLTLTFPRRDTEPTTPKVFVVTVPEYAKELWPLLPQSIKGNATFIQQQSLPLGTRPETYEGKAKELMTLYRDQATLVITTALHCALPCTAMGIPTVFIRPNNEDRFSTLDGIIPIWTFEDLRRGKVNFPQKAPDIDPLKALMIENLDLSIRKAKGLPVDADRLTKIRTDIAAFQTPESQKGVAS